MANSPLPLRPILAAVVAVAVVIVALPSNLKAGWAPSWLNPEFHFGLDLAGGTQLDFRISEQEMQDQMATLTAQIDEMEEQGGSAERMQQLRSERDVLLEQQQNLVEAIRTVLERRINALGVSEATITPSYIGGEKHLLVECPGVVDVQQCINTVGKTIQLEFKEEFTEATAEYEQGVRTKVAAALARVRGSGASLAVLGQDLGSQLGMGYEESHLYFQDQLPAGLESVWTQTPAAGIQQHTGSIQIQQRDDQGELIDQNVPGIFLIEVLEPRFSTGRIIQEAPKAFDLLSKTEPNTSYRLEQGVALDETVPTPLIAALRTMKAGELKVVPMDDGSAQLLFLRQFIPGREEVDVSHILIAYKGATAADATITISKEDALKKAQSIKAQIVAGSSFEELARTQSDGPSKSSAGLLGPIARGQLVPSFETVAFSQAPGLISDPVETPFGFHLIRVNKAPQMNPDQASFDALSVAAPDGALRAGAIYARLQAGTVQNQEEALRVRFLFFSLQPTGWKDTPLDGKHFRSATVTLDPTTNLPIVQIIFDEEGGNLFHELTKRNIGKRIAIFVGGELVSAPTVQSEIIGGTAVITGSGNFDEAKLLAQDLNTGAIPAPIHLSGQRTVEATLGSQSLQTSVVAGVIGMLIVMLYMLVVYRFLGVLASAALLIYATIFLALLKLPLFLLSNQYIVLTLAGAAGMILSIGMAVDTNVLVFERVKEELRKGKQLKTAVEIGFEKAWPSIRDSNISTIITCVLLFMIGTSIVRGFAVTLGLGVLISMFTGMVITRWMARTIANLPLAQKTHLFPGTQVPPSAPPTA